MHTYHKQQSSLWLAMKEKKRQNIVNGFGLMMVEKLRGHCYYVSLYVRRVMFVGMYALESAVMRWIMEVRKGLIALQNADWWGCVALWQEKSGKMKGLQRHVLSTNVSDRQNKLNGFGETEVGVESTLGFIWVWASLFDYHYLNLCALPHKLTFNFALLHGKVLHSWLRN